MTDTDSPEPKTPGISAKKTLTREERLAAQLRQNLRRRKAAANSDKKT